MAGPLMLWEVLKAQEEFSCLPNTLDGIIGDPYLCGNSSIFKAVREATLRLGYRYESNPPFPYRSFPLLALAEILLEKIIPITNNIYYLKKLESLRPRYFKMRELGDVGIISNNLLHESSHCIAHHILGGPPTDQFRTTISSEKPDILKIMLAESFANSTEFMAASFLGKSELTRAMVNCNMYFGLHSSGFLKLVKHIGLNSTAKISILLFLYSNFLAVGITAKGEKKIFDIIGLERGTRKSLTFRKNYNNVKKGALMLNPNFRVMATELYLKRLGFTKNLFRLLSFDPMDLILESSELKGMLEQLASVIEGNFIISQITEDKYKKSA